MVKGMKKVLPTEPPRVANNPLILVPNVMAEIHNSHSPSKTTRSLKN